MARTWTLHSTLTVTTGGALQANTRALTNDAGTEVYFIINDTPNQKIYSWDGATITDIAGTNFPEAGGGQFIADICVFDGDLFCAFGGIPTFGLATGIHRWNGGTSWTNEYSLRNELDTLDAWAAEGYAAGDSDSWVWPMDCDENYMAIVGTIGPSHVAQSNNRLWTRDTAGNYQVNEIQAGPTYTMPGYHLVGRSKGSDYSGLVAYNRIDANNFRPMLIANPDPWTYLTGASIGRAIPIGYGEGFSFFSQNIPTGTTTWELKYSNDWGDTLFTAGGLTRTGGQKASFKFKNLGDGVIMLNPDVSNQAYTWDADTNTFVADGTTGLQTIFDFFRLNGQLFALTNSSTANSVEMWTASEPACQAQFYYGIETPEFVSDLPFCVEPGALAISNTNIIAVLGGIGPAGQSVIFQQAPYTGEWNDISGIVPTGSSVVSVKFV